MLHTRVTLINVQETEGGPRARALEIPLRPFSTFARSRREEKNKGEKRSEKRNGEEKMNKESKSSKAWAEKGSKVLLRIPRASVSFTAT